MYRTLRALAAHDGESVRRGAEVSPMSTVREASSAKDWNLRGLLAIAFGHGVNDFYSGTVTLTIFFVATNAGLSAWYQGAVGFLWYLTSSIVQPLFGAFSDRHGRWWFIALGSAAGGGVDFVRVAVRLALGAGAAGDRRRFRFGADAPEAGKYAALLSGARKSGGISVFQIGGSIGFALGPLAIAALLAHFGRFARWCCCRPA